MKAVRFLGDGELAVVGLPDPAPGIREVLLAPAAVGVCGTDTHILDGHYPARPPVTLGHEVAGRVVALGDGARGLQVGDLVTVEPHRYCGVCQYCRRGMEHMCIAKEAYGVHLDGGMAELMVVPDRIAYRLPEGVDATIGALTEPLACCVHAMDRLGLMSGLPILIQGCGPAGALLVALARNLGSNPIVVSDTRPDRRDLGMRMGADVALDPSDPDFERQALALTGGDGFPYAVDAVGLPAVLESVIRLAARGARLLVFGVAEPHARASVSPNEIYTKELTLLGTAINPFSHLRAVGLLTRLPLHELRVAAYPLGKAGDAIAAARTGVSDKIQIAPGLNT
ncbi:MAG: alcohol dehydrogenase catalytic domain-containing protein [Micromonosporaceae bacterium]|nr:alcohol dehydrogenase catalytic domain-containing protein [Micromonosporaceae bacterium]